jgi:hypothetical protein
MAFHTVLYDRVLSHGISPKLFAKLINTAPDSFMRADAIQELFSQLQDVDISADKSIKDSEKQGRSKTIFENLNLISISKPEFSIHESKRDPCISYCCFEEEILAISFKLTNNCPIPLSIDNFTVDLLSDNRRLKSHSSGSFVLKIRESIFVEFLVKIPTNSKLLTAETLQVDAFHLCSLSFPIKPSVFTVLSGRAPLVSFQPTKELKAIFPYEFVGFTSAIDTVRHIQLSYSEHFIFQEENINLMAPKFIHRENPSSRLITESIVLNGNFVNMGCSDAYLYASLADGTRLYAWQWILPNQPLPLYTSLTNMSCTLRNASSFHLEKLSLVLGHHPAVQVFTEMSDAVPSMSETSFAFNIDLNGISHNFQELVLLEQRVIYDRVTNFLIKEQPDYSAISIPKTVPILISSGDLPRNLLYALKKGTLRDSLHSVLFPCLSVSELFCYLHATLVPADSHYRFPSDARNILLPLTPLFYNTELHTFLPERYLRSRFLPWDQILIAEKSNLYETTLPQKLHSIEHFFDPQDISMQPEDSLELLLSLVQSRPTGSPLARTIKCTLANHSSTHAFQYAFQFSHPFSLLESSHMLSGILDKEGTIGFYLSASVGLGEPTGPLKMLARVSQSSSESSQQNHPWIPIYSNNLYIK